MASPSGNRCGHDPANPKLELAKDTSPKVLLFIADAMRAAEGVFHDPRRFPELGGPRSERREALVRVAKGLLYFMDMLTLRVGLPRSRGRVAGITVYSLTDWTGLSRWRVERALSDLRRSGFICSSQPRQIYDGGYLGLPAVRVVTGTFFRRLGLGVRLQLERTRLSKHREKRRDQERSARPATSSPVQAFLRTTHVEPAERPLQRQEENQRREWLGLSLRLRIQHPDWPAERVRAETNRLLC